MSTTEHTPTDAEKFNEELLVLLNKYPNIRLTVTQQITINELAKAPEPAAEEMLKDTAAVQPAPQVAVQAGQQTAPKD